MTWPDRHSGGGSVLGLVDALFFRRSCSDRQSLVVPLAATAAVTSIAVALSYRNLAYWARCHFGVYGKLDPVVPLRRRLKVAILGGGISGTAVAVWLRDFFGDAHDLDLAVICDGPIGGRCQTVELQGQRYEAGAALIPGSAIYFQALMRRFGLQRRAFSGMHLPVGIFDGSDFLLCGVSVSSVGWHTLARLWTYGRIAWRFGLRPCWRLLWLRSSSFGLDWRGLREALAEGAAYAHPREMLSALGHQSLQLCERSAEQWLQREVGVPTEITKVILEPSLREGFGGQGCSDMSGLSGLVGLCSGGLSPDCFAACGGNEQVPKRAFQAARPRHLSGSARLVRRVAASKPHEPTFEVAYDASGKGEAIKRGGESSPASSSTRVASAPRSACSEAEGLHVEAFHLVIVAHPLETSTLRFEGCCGDAAGGEATSSPSPTPTGATLSVPSPVPAPSYRRVVAHFVHGTLDLRRFSKDAAEAEAEGAHESAKARLARRRLRGASREADGRLVEVPCHVPAQVWTTADAATPFYSVGLQLPVHISSSRAAADILKSAERGEPQVYRVLAPRQLKEHELDAWFLRQGTEPVRIVEWYACPQHNSPQGFRPFVLDSAGVYYVNAVEQACSSVEMSLIAARNVVNLVLDWVRRSQCF